MAAARAGHRAVTARIGEVPAFLAGHADQLPARTQPCPEVTTMTMTEPGFPVRITRGAPVVTIPEEIDITNAGHLRAPLLHAAAAPARPSWST